MGNVYALDSEKNLILYSTGNHICLRTSIGENLTRPVLLCSDFADSLSDIVYNNTVYYTYRNTSQDIIIRSITDLHDLYKISSHDTPDCFQPRIAAIQKFLILFYFVKNPIDDSYCLKALLPFQSDKKLTAAEKNREHEHLALRFTKLPSLRIINIPIKSALLLHLSDEEQEYIFTVTDSLQCERLYYESALPFQELTQCREGWKESQTLLDSTQKELEQNKNKLLTAQEQFNNCHKSLLKTQEELEQINMTLIKTQNELERNKEMLQQTQKERNANKQACLQAQEALALSKEQNTKSEADLANRDQLIESIRKQYDELMETAIKYREEAIKWHNKFYGK